MDKDQLTYEWTEYDHDYAKAMQDIRLTTGEEIEQCWPNAGYWTVCGSKAECPREFWQSGIPDHLVTHVRKNAAFYQ